jgi:hypothetical protein
LLLKEEKYGTAAHSMPTAMAMEKVKRYPAHSQYSASSVDASAAFYSLQAGCPNQLANRFKHFLNVF